MGRYSKYYCQTTGTEHKFGYSKFLGMSKCKRCGWWSSGDDEL